MRLLAQAPYTPPPVQPINPSSVTFVYINFSCLCPEQGIRRTSVNFSPTNLYNTMNGIQVGYLIDKPLRADCGDKSQQKLSKGESFHRGVHDVERHLEFFAPLFIWWWLHPYVNGLKTRWLKSFEVRILQGFLFLRHTSLETGYILRRGNASGIFGGASQIVNDFQRSRRPCLSKMSN